MPVEAIDISGIYFFMPVFSFLFVFLIVYAVLVKTKILGDSHFVNLLVGFIIAIIFMSFSSLELYVKTIVPWFVVLLVCVFLVLVLAGLSTKDLDKIMTPGFGWVIIVILILVFLISAIKVFNPVFHPDLVVTTGENVSLLEQIRESIGGQFWGTALLIIIAVIVAWVLTKS